MRDLDVRQAVKALLSLTHAHDPETLIVEEMGIWSGAVRVDIAVINGELSGIELKSDRDTLDRLPGQAELYNRVFDKVTLVVGARHVERACQLIPAWWGVMVARQDDGGVVSLSELRAPDANPTVDPDILVRLLWRDEALAILEAHGLDRGVRSKPAAVVYERLSTNLPFVDLSTQVRTALKSRSGWLGQPVGHKTDMTIDAN